MLEEIIAYISSLSPLWIYFALFFFSFIENIFPPSPSDVVVVFGATLISHGNEIHFLPVLLITSLGSSLGFMLMYFIGKLFGEKIIRAHKLKFITPESISKTDVWFAKYGYKLIAANRFLPGTRSVISFFAGFTELVFFKTFLYAAISAFLWNTLIIYGGVLLGNNIPLIDKYLRMYSDIGLGITVLVIIVILVRYFILKKKAKKN
ncbi:MAG: DedA family protein [Ignavibacteriales bacterium]|nr:DedA family protein [Ignavibacteriales bacterium]